QLWNMCFTVGFFFQAEDGIRDATVTGVQTCALPIKHRRAAHGGAAVAGRPRGQRDGHGLPLAHPRDQGVHTAGRHPYRRDGQARSEERRVGKEWWWRRWGTEGGEGV